MVQAADAAVKAQYWELTHGADPEKGSKRAAEEAVANVSQFADSQAKEMVAKKASSCYLEKDAEFKKTLKTIEEVKRKVGEPEEGAKNKYFEGCERVRKLI